MPKKKRKEKYDSRVLVPVTETMHRDLRVIAAVQGRSMAAVAREAFRAVLTLARKNGELHAEAPAEYNGHERMRRAEVQRIVEEKYDPAPDRGQVHRRTKEPEQKDERFPQLPPLLT